MPQMQHKRDEGLNFQSLDLRKHAREALYILRSSLKELCSSLSKILAKFRTRDAAKETLLISEDNSAVL
jgi:hypothetical protein